MFDGAPCPNSDLKDHFANHRRHILGIDAAIETPFGQKPLVYLDWTAMGREDIRVSDRIRECLAYFGNTHTDTNFTGEFTSGLYHEAHNIIGRHVNASKDDIVLFKGSGMTGAINWLQYMLGLRDMHLPHDKRPVILITHLEHHSNQTSWEESSALVRIVQAGPDGMPDLDHLESLCRAHADAGRTIYGSFTACSNVTGVTVDFYAMAKIVHRYGGKCFVDFAASAPYVDIDMHPPDPEERLDAIVFSPHKFLGGPGSAGVIVLGKELYNRDVPVFVGGGIVSWTNPWGGHSFYDNIQLREDAGTPQIVQGFKAGLSIAIKQDLQPVRMAERKSELVGRAIDGLQRITGVSVLEGRNRRRQGIVSFTVDGLHYALVVKLLNDLAGIQVRGGCSCAGTYGHYLFHIDKAHSKEITEMIDHGDNSCKPGWVRVSLHPTMSDGELELFLSTLEEIVGERTNLIAQYHYDEHSNTWHHKNGFRPAPLQEVERYFRM